MDRRSKIIDEASERSVSKYFKHQTTWNSKFQTRRSLVASSIIFNTSRALIRSIDRIQSNHIDPFNSIQFNSIENNMPRVPREIAPERNLTIKVRAVERWVLLVVECECEYKWSVHCIALNWIELNSVDWLIWYAFDSFDVWSWLWLFAVDTLNSKTKWKMTILRVLYAPLVQNANANSIVMLLILNWYWYEYAYDMIGKSLLYPSYRRPYALFWSA